MKYLEFCFHTFVIFSTAGFMGGLITGEDLFSLIF